MNGSQVERRSHVTVLADRRQRRRRTAPALVGVVPASRSPRARIHLVGDFALVDYTSSAGLRALLETVKETRQRGGDLRLAAVQPDVRRILDLAGFTQILKLYGNVEEAVASFPAGA